MSAPRIPSPTHERFLAAFFRGEGPGFYLSGGTALSAFYLQHRYSDDLDFFTRDAPALRLADQRIERAAGEAGLEIERVSRRGEHVQYFLSGDTEPAHPLVKCELVSDPPPYFVDPRSFDGVWVDDLLAIAVNKVGIITRYDPKDYFDRYLIAQSGRYRFEDLIALAKQKTLGLDDLTLAAHFKAIEDMPNLVEFQKGYMITPVDVRDVIRFFQDWAARLFEVVGPP